MGDYTPHLPLKLKIKKNFRKKFLKNKFFIYTLAYVIFLTYLCTDFSDRHILGHKSPLANMGE